MAGKKAPSYEAYLNYRGFEVAAFFSETAIASIDLSQSRSYTFSCPALGAGSYSVAFRANGSPFDILDLGLIEYVKKETAPIITIRMRDNNERKSLDISETLVSFESVTFSSNPDVYYWVLPGEYLATNRTLTETTTLPSGSSFRSEDRIVQDSHGNREPVNIRRYSGWGTFFSISPGDNADFTLQIKVEDYRVSRTPIPVDLVFLKLGR